MHAVAVAHSVHMVIGTDSCTYQSPGSNRPGRIYRESPVYLLSVHHAFARLGKQNDAFGTGSDIVLHLLHKKRQRVDIISCCRLNHIQMQVRAERVTRVAAKGYHLPRLYRIFPRFGGNLHFPAFLFILQVFHPSGYIAHKCAEVSVDSGITVIVVHIEHISRTVRHTDARDMPVCQSMYRLAYGSAGLEVQPTVKVIGAYLAEVTGKDNRKIERGRERCLLYVRSGFHIGRFLRISILYAACKKQKREKYRVFYILTVHILFFNACKYKKNSSLRLTKKE